MNKLYCEDCGEKRDEENGKVIRGYCPKHLKENMPHQTLKEEKMLNFDELNKEWEDLFYESDWDCNTLNYTKTEEKILEELTTFLPRHMPPYDWNLPFADEIILIFRRHLKEDFNQIIDRTTTHILSQVDEVLESKIKESTGIGAIPETNDYANGWNDCRKQARKQKDQIISDAQEAIKLIK